MDTASHWEDVYATKAPDAVSWYRPHLDRSLSLIEKVAVGRTVAIIDIGGGESTLVDDLLASGYSDVTVLDISRIALETARQRLEAAGRHAHWIQADIRNADLPRRAYAIWHDRAVFHFLTEPAERAAYVRAVEHAVAPGGHVLVSTFGPEGPVRCSGLDVVRYDAESLHSQFGGRFRLLESSRELHQTPWGSTQQFLYCLCRME